VSASVAAGVFAGGDLSTAWRETVLGVDRAPDQKLFHTVTRIDNSLREDSDVRRRVDELLRHLGHPSVETVANTIFPVQLASATDGPEELAERYRRMYPTIRRFPGNHHGTYFGRMVSYPDPKNGVDQLAKIITAMGKQLDARTTMSTGYEMALEVASDGADLDPEAVESDEESRDEAYTESEPGGTGTIYAPSDKRIRGFPCMSFVSFQVGAGTVHAFAHYRYEYLIEKGYGNYLGIARLQAYVAGQVGLDVGALTITAGRAHVDARSKRVLPYLIETPPFDL
jgi:hypothetical protein